MWYKFSTEPNGAAEYAAPLLIHEVVLRNEWRGCFFEEKLTAKIDTAASISAIPDEVAIRMKFPSAGTADDLQSFDHSIELKPYPKFSIRIFIPQWDWKIMTVIGCPRSDVLLGRDVCKDNLLFVNWRCGFGMKPAKIWHRPLELFFKRIKKKKM